MMSFLGRRVVWLALVGAVCSGSAARVAAQTLVNENDFVLITQERITGGKNESGDRFGVSLAVGDFDNDGHDDVAIGAPGEAPGENPHSGVVFLLQGSGGGPTRGKYGYITEEDGHGVSENGDEFGFALASGDFNHDGYDDLAVGAPGEAPGGDPASGVVFLFYGSASGLVDGSYVTQLDAGGANEDGDRFGHALAAGDFDGDGFDDLAIGAPGEAPGNDPASGAIFIFPGSGSGLAIGSFLTQANAGGANEDGDEFGHALAAGDFNGDGRDDLAVGGPGEAPGNDPASGAIFIFPGSGSGLAAGGFLTQTDARGSNEAGDRFGHALAVGDFNNDGRDDLAVGAPGEAPGGDPESGAIFLFPGSGSGLASGRFLTQTDAGGANEAGDEFGFALAAGDLDGDGRDDLVVGAPGEAPGGDPTAGAVFLFRGAGADLGTGEFVTQEQMGGTNEPGDRYGSALVLGDLNADGAADLLIGAPDEAPGNDPESGAVFFIAGLNHSPVLTHGGLLGAVTDTGIKIWCRADRAVALRVQHRVSGSPAPWTNSAAVNLTSAQDFTGTVTLSGLAANTTYDYRIRLDNVVQPGSQATFRTLDPTDSPGSFTFAIGADTGFDVAPYPIFDQIALRDPDFAILMGDQFYEGPVLIPDTRSAYEGRYKENFAETHMRSFMRRFPVFMTWDDHEIINNWSQGKVGRYLNAKIAFDEYQGQHNPSPQAAGENYYTFKVGQVDFYVLDTRTFRTPNGSDDSMLGAAQKTDLKNWLSGSSAKFKFIVSSVPWSDFANTGTDSWEGFPTERAEIFNFVRDNEIRGVVLLSGDQHWTGVFRLTQVAPYFLYEFSPTPLGRSNRSKTLAATDPACLLEQACFLYNGSRVYGFFEVDTTVSPARIVFDVYRPDNVSIFHLEITEDDISPP